MESERIKISNCGNTDTNGVSNTCVDTLPSSCVNYEGYIGINTTISDSCTNQFEVNEDLYKLTDTLFDSINVKDFTSSCLTIPEDSTIADIVGLYEPKICELLERITNLENAPNGNGDCGGGTTPICDCTGIEEVIAGPNIVIDVTDPLRPIIGFDGILGSGGIDNIVEDITPQLGGNLDTNSFNIFGQGNINITGSVLSNAFVKIGGTGDGVLLDDGTVTSLTALQNSGGGGTGNITLTENVTATLDVGGVEENDVLAQGTSFTDVIKAILSPVILPTISSQASLSVTGISSQTLEIGTPFTDQINISFNRGLIDNKNAAPNIPLVGPQNNVTYNGNGVNATGAISTPILSGSNSWSAILSYDAGTGAYFDSNGNPANNLDGQRMAGTLSDSTNTITGRYRRWYTTGAQGSTPNISTGVRALPNTGFATSGNFTITIPANTKEVAFYVPDTLSLSTALYVESSNADVTSTFTESAITVDDAGGNSIGYKKYTAIIGGTGYPSIATYSITLN